MDREQTTIRLPAELKEQLQREADKARKAATDVVYPYVIMILSPVAGVLLAILIALMLF